MQISRFSMFWLALGFPMLDDKVQLIWTFLPSYLIVQKSRWNELDRMELSH